MVRAKSELCFVQALPLYGGDAKVNFKSFRTMFLVTKIIRTRRSKIIEQLTHAEHMSSSFRS